MEWLTAFCYWVHVVDGGYVYIQGEYIQHVYYIIYTAHSYMYHLTSYLLHDIHAYIHVNFIVHMCTCTTCMYIIPVHTSYTYIWYRYIHDIHIHTYMWYVHGT